MLTDITIEAARQTDALQIVPLIMEAMNYECCQNWAGPNHTLDDFQQLMLQLVEADESQYSYRNAIVARRNDGMVVGVCVSYDGADLHRLRRAFIQGARQAFDIDYSNIDDETEAGEYYLDSLAVDASYRGHGIAHRLLQSAIDAARQRGAKRVALLVDQGNPSAERLYSSLGFRFANDTAWGGHAMRHLVIDF